MSKDSARKTVAYIDGKKINATITSTASHITVTVAGTSTSLSATAPDGSPVNITADGILQAKIGSTVSTATSGFSAYSEVESWCYSTPTKLGSETTNGVGATAAGYKIPGSISLGNHHLVIRGTNSQGQAVTIGFAMRVSDDSLITRIATSPLMWAVLAMALLLALFLPSRLRRREIDSQ